MNLFEHFMDTHAVLKRQHLLQGGNLERRYPITAASVSIYSCRCDRCRLTESAEWFQGAIKQVKEDGLRHDFYPVCQNKEESTSEYRTLVILGGICALCPFVGFNVLENKVDIQASFKLHFELFLHFTDNTDQVK